jgi:ABC-2 type transport system ATP-binding protein
MTMTPMLEALSLKKSYGTIKAVDDISIHAAKGETVGLLGPNGAGKTTTVSLIAGLIHPDSGRVLIDGKPTLGDTNPVKRQIGLVPQDLALYDELSATANLHLFAALYCVTGSAARKAIERVLDLVGLRDRAKDRVLTFSGGMKRRLNLAAALLHDPQVLLLDEPTVGVDPQSRNAIFDNLETLKNQGKTLIYTTHYMEEAERLCDRIVIVDHGKVVADDTLKGLYRRLPATNILTVDLTDPAHFGDPELGDIGRIPGVQRAELKGHRLTCWLTDLSDCTPVVIDWLSTQRLRYDSIGTETPSLEAVFLTLTGRSLRD